MFLANSKIRIFSRSNDNIEQFSSHAPNNYECNHIFTWSTIKTFKASLNVFSQWLLYMTVQAWVDIMAIRIRLVSQIFANFSIRLDSVDATCVCFLKLWRRLLLDIHNNGRAVIVMGGRRWRFACSSMKIRPAPLLETRGLKWRERDVWRWSSTPDEITPLQLHKTIFMAVN